MKNNIYHDFFRHPNRTFGSLRLPSFRTIFVTALLSKSVVGFSIINRLAKDSSLSHVCLFEATPLVFDVAYDVDIGILESTISEMSPKNKKSKESGIYNAEVSTVIASLIILFGLAATYPNADISITSLWHRVMDATLPEDKADIISIILAESTGAFSSFLFPKILDYAFRDEISWKLTSTKVSSEIAVTEEKHMVLSDLEIMGRMLKVMEKSYSLPSGNSDDLPKEKTKMYPALIGVDIMADILKWLSYDVYSTHWQIFFEKFPYFSASSHDIERLIIGGMAGFTYHLYMDVVKYFLNYDDAHMTRGKKYIASSVLSESYVTEIVAASVLFYVYDLSKSPVSTWVLESCGG